MGQVSSIPLEDCVRLQPSNEDYMVRRTSGLWESGWAFSDKGHKCSYIAYNGPVATLLKYDDVFVWAIYMTNNSIDPNKHACKWSKIEDMFPSRLSGDIPAIELWRIDMIATLEKASHIIPDEVETKTDS